MLPSKERWCSPGVGVACGATVAVVAGQADVGRVEDAADRVAAVDRAGVLVVDRRRGARHAGAGAVAGLVAVAGVAVRAGRAGGGGRVVLAGDGIAQVEGAGVGVVDVDRSAGLAGAGRVAGVAGGADVAVVAGQTLLDGVRHAGDRVAGVDGAGIAVVGGIEGGDARDAGIEAAGVRELSLADSHQLSLGSLLHKRGVYEANGGVVRGSSTRV